MNAIRSENFHHAMALRFVNFNLYIDATSDRRQGALNVFQSDGDWRNAKQLPTRLDRLQSR
jgi:hypothetical protein